MRILVTGGAGFIGANATRHFAREGHDVTVLDNLSRPGSVSNLRWLKSLRARIRFVKADIRDPRRLEAAVQKSRCDAVVHLAAQVAVTTSVVEPREDYETNCFGTFNVLEAVRKSAPDAYLLYASTNKVYGGLTDIATGRTPHRYYWKDCRNGINESRPLDFHSPYGCSKGAADSYVIDYARIYGLRTMVLRQSCIYGYRQFGVEDQGWVAWFLIAAEFGRPITVYGDGRQVRDLLFIDDLVRCYSAALMTLRSRPKASGIALNIGGGAKNTLSIRELVSWLKRERGRNPRISYATPRPGDQRIFVADVTAARRTIGWRPQVGVDAGLRRLADWIRDNRNLFAL